ncbi:uncharacterized protein IUM83_11815 [Phytophthora cinnamomi]|uniref:uncharacterized protein n=1 Tax=Phytophthora cinnamomi TaxID=4785 RepID=UPI0035596297|nr:hypothetical protein IUM83_11815 [Phytophthora cinnamomi]
MPLTNAQLRAEIDRLTQAMADRSKVTSHLPKFTGKRGEDVRDDGKAGIGWFLRWSSTTRNEEHTWGIFREHVLQHFEASNYQSVLRERLQRLKQTADIETYNSDYSALIFRVEGMSVLDQVLNYANGLKPRTRSYVKLENPETLSDAMDLAVKYEVTHLVEEVRDRQVHQAKTKERSDNDTRQDKRSKGKPFRGKGRFKPRSKPRRSDDKTCFFCKKPGHIKADCFAWKREQAKQGNDKPRQCMRVLAWSRR